MNGWLAIARKIAEDRLAMCGLVIVLGLVFVALFAPYLATHPDDVWNIHPAIRLQPPSMTNFLGTDRLGDDIYSRLLFGARITILIAVIAAVASLVIGVPIGLIAGYYHNWFSDILMRGADVFLAIPQVVLAIAIAQTLGPNIQNVIIA